MPLISRTYPMSALDQTALGALVSAYCRRCPHRRPDRVGRDGPGREAQMRLFAARRPSVVAAGVIAAVVAGGAAARPLLPPTPHGMETGDPADVSAAGKLPAPVVSLLKLNFYLVTYSDTRCVQGGTAHANAEAAASDEHRAPRKGDAVERAGHPHLAAPAELGDQIRGNVDHGEAARLVLPPAADTPTK